MLLRPSSAHRWWRCAMSASVTQQPGALPDETIDAAREGTCAAWVVETVISSGLADTNEMIGETHENGWVVDADMARNLQPMVDFLRKRDDARCEVFREQRLGNGFVLGGTLDAESWQGTTLRIDDLKYGYDVVEPFENKQLICYTYLKLAEMQQQGQALPSLIVLGIYQPRAIHPDGPYRRWTVKVEELRPYFEELMSVISNISTGLACPGDHCDHCQGAAGCVALTHSVYSMWNPIESRVFHAPTGQQLSDELGMLERMERMLKARKAAVTAEAEIRIGTGKVVPGWSVETKRGNRAFSHPPEMIHAMTGVNPYTDPKPCTPAELVRRGVDEKIVNSLSHRPAIGSKLQRVDGRHFENLFKGKD